MAMMARGRATIQHLLCHLPRVGRRRGRNYFQASIGSRRLAPWRPPLSLHTEAVLEQPIGKIFNTITNGVDRENERESVDAGLRSADRHPKDRWAIVLYVLALQRSRNAVLDDLPVNEREALQLPDLNQ